jgi:hypothetical protein
MNSDDITGRALNAAAAAAQEPILEFAQRFDRREGYLPLEELAHDVMRQVLEAGLVVIHEEAQFDPSQQQAALVVIERMVWGDMDDAIRDLEICLRRALEATSADFRTWQDGDFEERFGDEFSLSDAQVEELSSEDRLAYVARLLRSLALHYGVSAEFGDGRDGLVGQAQPNSPAALLRGLDPTTAGHRSPSATMSRTAPARLWIVRSDP